MKKIEKESIRNTAADLVQTADEILISGILSWSKYKQRVVKVMRKGVYWG
jgi:hypothetical protein